MVLELCCTRLMGTPGHCFMMITDVLLLQLTISTLSLKLHYFVDSENSSFLLTKVFHINCSKKREGCNKSAQRSLMGDVE